VAHCSSKISIFNEFCFYISIFWIIVRSAHRARSTHHVSSRFVDHCGSLWVISYFTSTPKSVMVDFEKAAINAFEGTFNTTTNPTTISGCFFHLQKSIQRKVQVSHIFCEGELFFLSILGPRIQK
jgi:hypothetical protein